MIQIVVSIRDSAVNAFMRPWFVPAVGAAVRSFADEAVRADGDIVKHPADYELFELGTFDDSTARFTMLAEPRSLARGADYGG
ncbi:MAG: nonstructural protein [Arizlama microvirus]|nr:MAG: nonstructural protein [Arizlama microvirus]